MRHSYCYQAKPSKALPVLTEDQRTLAANHYRLAISLATKVAKRGCWYKYWDEIVSEATHALVWAAHAYDQSKGFQFSTYATRCIAWRIVRKQQEIIAGEPCDSLDELGAYAPASRRNDQGNVEDREQVERFLRVIPEDEADAVRKVCLEGWSAAEYAAELGVSRVTIHKRKARGLEAMRHVACSA